MSETVERHPGSIPVRGTGSGAAAAWDLRELVVCSLELWDEIWRRNQFFVDALLGRNPGLRVLFVEPASDVLHDLSHRRRPASPRSRTIGYDGRLRAFRPLKPLPRRLGSAADRALLAQVRLAARAIGFERPSLWINDVTYAPLICQTGWPSLYDVTDDWLLAPFPPRELERLRRLDELALALSDEVVVCSPALVATRGAQREVSMVPNGVDLAHFRHPRPRPTDLPDSPTAVYVGTLHESRLDVELVSTLATEVPQLNVVLVGPDSLEESSRRRLTGCPNILILGPRPYSEVPAYLQHADVVVVPHRVTAFTESLDPIKAYECLAIDRPTVATPVAGFRDLRGSLDVVSSDEFPARVARVVGASVSHARDSEPPGWEDRAAAFEAVLLRAQAKRRAT
jgi:glycosyltransferase involved in cell wall biosynthesis